jgi:hypothetical protein
MWEFPSLAECRTTFERKTGSSIDWPSEDEKAA